MHDQPRPSVNNLAVHLAEAATLYRELIGLNRNAYPAQVLPIGSTETGRTTQQTTPDLRRPLFQPVTRLLPGARMTLKRPGGPPNGDKCTVIAIRWELDNTARLTLSFHGVRETTAVPDATIAVELRRAK
jgi:hypothetical protein